MLAAKTTLPVLGVPVPSRHLQGLDSLLSIVQMPAGVPVATVSIAGARNAGLLAVRILASGTDELADRLRTELLDFAQELNDVASRKGANLRQKVNEVFSDSNVALRSSR
jgi:5-(carboxyamino)imidazole ribonucleotide mutase